MLCYYTLLYRPAILSKLELSIISTSSALPNWLEQIGVLNESCFWRSDALLPPDGFAEVITLRALLFKPLTPVFRKVLRELNSVVMVFLVLCCFRLAFFYYYSHICQILTYPSRNGFRLINILF